MNDVENEVEEQQAEDGLVNRVPELKQLSEDIDKATNTFINATLELESAIQQYQRAEVQLGGAVTTIGKKVDTINQHINKVLENAPNQLKVSVNVELLHIFESMFAIFRKLHFPHIPNFLRLFPTMPHIDDFRSLHCPMVLTLPPSGT